MRTIFVDDLSLLAEPVFLTVQDPTYRIVTTAEAVRSLRTLSEEVRSAGQVLEFLERAIADDTVQVLPASKEEPDFLWDAPDTGELWRLQAPERSVVIAALTERQERPRSDVWVSLGRQSSIEVASRLGLRAARANVIRHTMRGAARHPLLAHNVYAFRRTRTIGTIVTAVLLLAALLVAVRAIGVWRQDLGAVNPWAAAVSALVFGVGLFAFRSRSRLQYGAAEVAFGCVLTATAFVANDPAEKVTIARLFQAMGGVYVIVRGLDNIGVGVRRTRFEKLWRQMF